jgi:hypothetical protein
MILLGVLLNFSPVVPCCWILLECALWMPSLLIFVFIF